MKFKNYTTRKEAADALRKHGWEVRYSDIWMKWGSFLARSIVRRGVRNYEILR